MAQISYGGIIVKTWDTSQIGWLHFAQDKYHLSRYKGHADEKIPIPNLSHFTAYSPPSQLWSGEGVKAEIQLNTEEIWFAGVTQPQKIKTRFLEKKLEAYPVSKPWGAEFWLSQEHPLFCFKKIRLHKGQRTSLQFHQEKQETNVFVSGKLRLHFQKNGTARDPIFHEELFSSVEIEAPVTMDISPYTVHRIEAISDLEFLEISTPQVHDVIRISDDTKRANGRIESEHRR